MKSKALMLMMGMAVGGLEAACVTANVDYLYWHASQSDMNYALTVEDIDTFANMSANFQRSDWASGVRLGVGYAMPCSWDSRFTWTRFHNSVFGQTASHFILANQLLSITAGDLFIGGEGVEAGPAKSRWDLNFDKFDLNFGGTLCNGRVFFFHPAIGITGIIVNQSQHISYDNFIDTFTERRANVTVKQVNNFWGIGPSAGFDSALRVGCGFSLVGQCTFSAYYGRVPSKSTTSIEEGGETVTSSFMLKRNKIVPAFQMFFGLEWGTKLLRCYPISATIGYETQYFWGLWRTQNSGIQDLYITDAGYNALEFSGITARVSFGF